MGGRPNRSESGETECKGTLEIPGTAGCGEAEHEQVGRNGTGTLPRKAVASRTWQGWILPPPHGTMSVAPFVAAVAVV